MASPEEIFREAVSLPVNDRVELAERLIASLADDIDPNINTAQVAEVRRRITQLASGEVASIPGDEVLENARKLLSDL